MSDTEYKQVQIGPKSIEIPQDWGMKMAGELFDIRKDRVDPSQLDEVVDLYSMPAFDEGKKPKKEDTSEIGSKKYLVPDDTLLFPKLNIRKQRFWRVKRESKTKGICSTEYWPLIPQEDLDLDFYNFYFRTHEFRSHPKVSSSSSTNSHKRVNQSSFEKVKLPVPPLPEQRKIAEMLSTVDEAIQQTDEIIETSKELKKGLMQVLLTKGIRHDNFKEIQLGPKRREIPENWDIKRLDDISRVKRGASPRPIGDDKWFGGDVGWLRISDVSSASKYVMETEDYLSEEGQEESVRAYPGEVVLSIAATVGKPCILDIDVCIHDGIIAFKDLDEEIDEDFLYYTMLWEKNRLISKGQTGTQANINSSIVGRFKIHVPPLTEQKDIAEKLSTVDEKIRQEEEYREKLEELKKGLMQDLLTGKERVEPKEG